MTVQTAGGMLERALTVGGIGRDPTGALSPVTREIYATQVGKAQRWKLTELGSSSRTFTPEQVAQYALWLVENGYARSTAGLAVRAIRWNHRVAGLPVPDGFPAYVVLRAGDRTSVDHPGVNDLEHPARRDPSELLSGFASACRPGTSKGRRDLALINALYWSGYTTDQLAGLNLADVLFVREHPDADMTIDLHLRGGALDAATPRVLRHLTDPGHYATLCPVCTISTWVDLLVDEHGQTSDTALFRSIAKGDVIAGTAEHHAGRAAGGGRLSPKSMNAHALRNVAAEAGLRDVLVSPARALRLAGACAAYVAGEVDVPGAALRAGYAPGSLKFVTHLLELTAPQPRGHDQ